MKIRTLILFVVIIVTSLVSLEMLRLPSALKAQHYKLFDEVAITNVNVISMDQTSEKISYGQTVIIKHGVISYVGPISEIAFKSKVINANGMYLMPGLIDAHVHLSDEAELAGYLTYGVTGIRNMSGYPFHIRLQNEIVNNKIISPDFITTGPILNSDGPNSNIIQQVVNSEYEARTAVRQQYDAGFRTLKLYSNLTKEAYKGILAEANSLGMSITGHTPEGVRTSGIPFEKFFTISWEESLDQDYVTLEHTETVIWHALEDRLEQSSLAYVADTLKTSGNKLVPTLVAHNRLVQIAESKGKYLESKEQHTVNPLVRLGSKGPIDYWSHMDPSNYEKPHQAFFQRATKVFYQRGVPILVGTDAGGFGLVPGRSMLEELELLSQCCMSRYDALYAATYVNAQALGFMDAGKVKPSFKANLILTKINPLDDISALNDIEMLFLGERTFNKEQLDAIEEAAYDTSIVRSFVRLLELFLFIS